MNVTCSAEEVQDVVVAHAEVVNQVRQQTQRLLALVGDGVVRQAVGSPAGAAHEDIELPLTLSKVELCCLPFFRAGVVRDQHHLVGVAEATSRFAGAVGLHPGAPIHSTVGDSLA